MSHMLRGVASTTATSVVSTKRTDNQPTTQAVVPCEFCEGACKLFHKTACETDHNAPDYYYYTYKCEKCGNEFTIEIIQE